MLNIYLSKLSPLNDTVKIDCKTNSRKVYIFEYTKNIQPNETSFQLFFKFL